MTLFARYFDSNRKLIEVPMSEMKQLITDEKNRIDIANHVYERLYTRFLKIFDFHSAEEAEYKKNGESIRSSTFNEEYKNGFLQMAACSLVVETFAAFLTGEKETPNGAHSDRFNKVFEYAQTKNNPLHNFYLSDFYNAIRCGLLHQGEVKKKYLITRAGRELLEGDKIDAYLFHKHLKELLQSYRDDLSAGDKEEWTGDKWEACRLKISYIIDNSK